MQRFALPQVTAATGRSTTGGGCPTALPLHRGNAPGKRPRGFTLVEALVAISIVAIAGSVLLLAVESSLQTTWDAVDKTVAEGLAQQLLDEVATKRYMAIGDSPLSTAIGPSASEKLGKGRERFDDSDDFHNFSAMPVQDIWGERLGSGDDEGGKRHPSFRISSATFENWRQRIQVYYVDPNDHSRRVTTPSYFRAVEVHIEYVQPDGGVRPLASRKRVIAYVPPPA